MKLLTTKNIEIASVVIAGAGLLYVLFHKSGASIQTAGSSVPVLLGSGGDSGGTGLSPTSGDGGATEAPIIIPANPPITTGSVYAPSVVQTFLNALANPNGFGCCAQNASVPYEGNAPIYAPPTPAFNVEDTPAYQSSDGVNWRYLSGGRMVQPGEILN